MYILGISCFYHDSSACILRDGEIIAAAQEERFSRVKNTSEFPIESIRFCLKFANIPRALGNRSIIGNATFEGMKDILNLKIKKREAFRPFAPIVLEERANEYFHLPVKSPYMLIAPQVRKDKVKLVPAITHVDGTARVQTCDQSSNAKLRQLIVQFEKLSGVPVIINTSFNGKGEPVVCQPVHAIRCFVRNEMDVLAIGSFLVETNSANSNEKLSEKESAL